MCISPVENIYYALLCPFRVVVCMAAACSGGVIIKVNLTSTTTS